MTKPINLRQARKQKRRVEKQKTATENRVKFGQTQAEKKLIDQKQAIFERQLDGHLRPPKQ